MAKSHIGTFVLGSLSGLELVNVEAERVTYQGRQAVRLIKQGEPDCAIAILPASDFLDGVIETEIAGMRPRLCAVLSALPFVSSLMARASSASS